MKVKGLSMYTKAQAIPPNRHLTLGREYRKSVIAPNPEVKSIPKNHMRWINQIGIPIELPKPKMIAGGKRND
jgi:hypothetical protein